MYTCCSEVIGLAKSDCASCSASVRAIGAISLVVEALNKILGSVCPTSVAMLVVKTNV